MPKASKTYEDEFRAVFERQCHYYGYNTRKKQEKALGIDEEMLYRHLKNPDLFRRKHLLRIYKVLHFTKDERDLLNHTGRINLC